MTTQKPLPVNLSKAQIDEFGREIELIYEEAMTSRGDRDRAYILNLIRTQRSMAFTGRMIIYAGLFFLPMWAHALASWTAALLIMAVGAIMLGASKILENMEIGHNVLHAQWDWMKDPEIQSNTWEWDMYGASDRWMNSHNVIHHTWTNVLGKDSDVGYGILRVTPMQNWQPRFLVQPILFLLQMIFFAGAIALHEQAIDDISKGKARASDHKALFKHIATKFWGMLRKDYIMWPGLAALLAIPISFVLPSASPLLTFALVAASNAVANFIRNVWTFIIIFCGHFPDGAYVFTPDQVEGESRGQWYLRQMLGSANIEGGVLFHILSGNLSHQIEHHLFPDLCSNRYPEVAPRVEAMAARYGLPYNKGSIWRQFGSTWKNNIRLAFPGGKPQPEIASA
jgi:fatty acid desaturase